MIRNRRNPRRPQRPARPANLFARPLLAAVPCAILLAACTPRVTMEAPKEPITINMNVKIEHEVRIMVDRELEDLFAKNPELF